MIVRDKELRPPRRSGSLWPIIAAALAWLVVLAVLVHDVATLIELWCVSAAGVVAYIVWTRRDPQPSATGENHDQAAPLTSPPIPPPPIPPPVGAVPAAGPAEAGASASLSQPAPSMSSRPTVATAADVLTAEEVAKILRYPVPKVVSAIKDGLMPGNGLGDDWRVRAQALDQWLDGSYGVNQPASRRRPNRKISPG